MQFDVYLIQRTKTLDHTLNSAEDLDTMKVLEQIHQTYHPQK